MSVKKINEKSKKKGSACSCKVGDKLEHPKKGKGKVSEVRINSNGFEIFVEWNNPVHSILGADRFNQENIHHLVFEREYANKNDVKKLVDDEEDPDENTLKSVGKKRGKDTEEVEESYLDKPLRSEEQAKKDREEDDKKHGLKGGRDKNGDHAQINKGKVVKEGYNIMKISYQDLMEADMPSPKDSLLTGTKPAKTNNKNKSLADIGGFDSFKEPNLLDFDKTDDSMNVPSVLQSEGGNASPVKVKGSTKKKAKKVNDDAPEDSEKPSAPKAEKTSEKSGEKNENPFAKKAKKDNVEESIFEEDEEMDIPEHDMGTGEINVTIEFMTKLLQSVSQQTPDSTKLEYTVKAISDSMTGNEPLDVQDIPNVMSKIKDMASGGASDSDTEDMDDDGFDEDVGPGDGEPAGPEGGSEHEGKTKLMADKTGINEAMAAIPSMYVSNHAPIEEDDEDDFEAVLRTMKRRATANY